MVLSQYAADVLKVAKWHEECEFGENPTEKDSSYMGIKIKVWAQSGDNSGKVRVWPQSFPFSDRDA